MKRLLSLLREHWAAYALALVCTLLSALTPILCADALGAIVDAVVAGFRGMDGALLRKWILLSAGALLIGLGAGWWGTRAQNGLEYRLRKEFIAKLVRLAPDSPAPPDQGRILALYGADSATAVSFLCQLLPGTARSLLSFAVALAYLLGLHWAIVAACVIPALGALFVTMRASRPLGALRTKSLEAVEDLHRQVADGIYGREDLLLCQADGPWLAHFQETARRAAAAQTASENAEAGVMALSVGQHNLSMALVLAVAGFLSLRGALSVGDVVASVSLFSILSNMVRTLARTVARWRTALVSVRRLDAFFSAREERADACLPPQPRGNAAPALEVRLERFSCEEGFALREISFSLARGERLAVVGRSGCGKSTLARLIAAGSDRYRGEIRLFGADVRSLSPEDLREAVAYWPAGYDIHLEYNRALLDRGRLPTRKAFAAAQASALRKRYLRGEEEFSGGERQRVVLALACLRGGEVFLFDELFSAVSERQGNRIRKGVEALYPRVAIVYITHQKWLLPQVDRVLWLENGQIAGLGRHADLLRESEAYRRFIDTIGEGEADA